jgi:glucan phosphoethanolaminetransferase (alkaline phosphatase superfamily)
MTKTVWESIEAGELSAETVREEYTENLRYVLEDVEILLKNINAETVVITSDHGNAIGEHGVYGHPPNTPIPALVRVPWYTTTAQNDGSHQPQYNMNNNQYTAAKKIEDRLQDLGYK